MTVAAILNEKGREVITERGGALLLQICQTLGTNKIGAMVIVDAKGHIEGIISERDIVKAIGRDGPDALNQPVSQIMTKAVVTCTEEETVNQVMQKMSSGRFRHVPVVKDKKLNGLISIGDVVKHRIAQVEMEAEHMRTYIAMT
ncbi:CBS domain-containing protein [Roseibium litorale]|uniref:CBS domain-containing protein n=1 Tax=Roseibium litorale TaxID=2803841 RepID=A0ABR9CHG0_9HYPH|nr:CBS domain-containing protein [Roseibium litorale]MBD8890286.1 CBS domain-containing protein [Roseibium litorale]